MQKFIAIGNVGQDPDVKLVGEHKVANFSVATTERGFTRKDGVKVEDRTEWHNIVLWRGLAEIAEKYVHKGDKLYIEGKIRTRSYDDQNGVKRYMTEIFADSIEMLGSKQSDNSSTSQSEQAKIEERAKEFQHQPFPPRVDNDGLPF